MHFFELCGRVDIVCSQLNFLTYWSIGMNDTNFIGWFDLQDNTNSEWPKEFKVINAEMSKEEVSAQILNKLPKFFK